MNHILRAVIMLAAVLAWSRAGFTDTAPVNLEYSAQSPNGRYLIRMIPAENGAGQGVVYKQEGEAQEELWKVDFYASEVLLADDGRHLVAFGPWASEMTDKALAFYKEGHEMKTYLVQDLIEEGRVLRSTSHFLWKDPENAKASWFSEDGSEFTIKLIDGSLITFDVETGEIKIRS